MIKKLFIPLVLALSLVACVPTMEPTPERTGDLVVITMETPRPLYSVTLSVLNATTDDARCVVINVTDLGCVLGDFEADSSTTVIVSGEEGEVVCSAFGFTEPDMGIGSYRLFPCGAGG